ncbi:hypothetical protein ABFX02_13G021200 [Erythranthe guttata]
MAENCFLDLEVDVNGEQVFFVNKGVLSSYSEKISKLVTRSKGVNQRLKVIFNDFPGGASNFELVARFCYNNGKVNIDPTNISNLNCAAHFMEMNKPFSKNENLFEKTEKSLDEIRYWTWSDLLTALKQCQDLTANNSSSSNILDKFLDSLITRIASSCQASPCPSISSSECSGTFRLSCDTRSTESLKNTSIYRLTWWFEDLSILDTGSIRMLVKLMVSRNFENGIISRFLFHYQKSRFASASVLEKTKIVETVIDMLDSLDIRSISYKGLFVILSIAINTKVGPQCMEKLEIMIGSQLDRANLDDLLFPSSARRSYLYDVNLVLRFLKAFLGKGVCCVPLSRLKKVGSLMDLYLAEVAPDPHLKPSKFLALMTALPDSARDSCDGIYHAVDLYLEVHSRLSEEQKTKICLGINYENLSSEAFNHLAKNPKFPSKSAIQALVSQHRKLKGLLQNTDEEKQEEEALFTDSPSNLPHEKKTKDEGSKQIVLYAKRLMITDENEKMKTHLQGMQWRVVELETICRKMQLQMAKMMKSRMSGHNGNSAKSVPRLCS